MKVATYTLRSGLERIAFVKDEDAPYFDWWKVAEDEEGDEAGPAAGVVRVYYPAVLQHAMAQVPEDLIGQGGRVRPMVLPIPRQKSWEDVDLEDVCESGVYPCEAPAGNGDQTAPRLEPLVLTYLAVIAGYATPESLRTALPDVHRPEPPRGRQRLPRPGGGGATPAS